MGYVVKEIFFTLQGEGFHAGTPAVFCRFAGCNLWTGKEAHRQSAVCQFCDTDFVGTDGPGGAHFPSPHGVADAIASCWGDRTGSRFVVLTGGEPLLQVDTELVAALHEQGFTIAVETNGTCEAPSDIDWVCVSPKAGTDLVIKSGDELKLVFPQPGLGPADVRALDFDHFFLQPMAGSESEANTAEAVEYCLANPTWRLSVQTHKYLGIP